MASKRMGTAETKRVTEAEAQQLSALLESATRLLEQNDVHHLLDAMLDASLNLAARRESATRLSEQNDGQDLLDSVFKVTHVGIPAPYPVDCTDVWAWSRTAVR